MIKFILKSSVLSTMFISAAFAGQKASDLADNTTSGFGSFTDLLIAGFALFGLALAGFGVAGLMKEKSSGGQDTNGDHMKKIIGGAVMFSLFGILTAVNMEVFGGDTELQQTRTLLQQNS